jgi:hypothetical protein
MSLALWEAWSYAQAPLVWWLFRRFARREVAGQILAGTLMGLYIEFATEPLWDYHFQLAYYKDIPPSVPLGWGVMFALVAFLAERLYVGWTGRPADPEDKRLLILDALAGVVVGVPLEKMGLAAGVWDYRYDLLGWDWGHLPFFGMPYEAVVGYALLMLVGPTYVRRWGRSLDPFAR